MGVETTEKTPVLLCILVHAGEVPPKTGRNPLLKRLFYVINNLFCLVHNIHRLSTKILTNC